MSADERRARAIRIMDGFARRTGLDSDASPKRYLWTDAFAVCNWLGLHVETGEDRFLGLARRLVDQVHEVLGRHRGDDGRQGWISGLSEAEGREHPTAGGLRIGKPLPERGASEPHDPRAEWDRDGQYYHYLTKWTFALGRMWRVTGERRWHRLGVELARAAHSGFMVGSAPGRRLAWKMSIDLSRPLVPSSGHHDPLDGVVVASGLVATRPEGTEDTVLSSEIDELLDLCRGASWLTADPLGAGGLLVDALRCAQLANLGHRTGPRMLARVLEDAARSLELLSSPPFLRRVAGQRLAFRELGLALGLEAAGRLVREGPAAGAAAAPALRRVESASAGVLERPEPTATGAPEPFEALPTGAPGRFAAAAAIVDFWSDESNRQAETWLDHRDINEVMWATCLEPRGFLDL